MFLEQIKAALSFLSVFPDLWIGKILLLLFAFFGAIGGIVVVWQGAKRVLFKRQLQLRQIARLAPGTTLGFFRGILGAPVFVTSGARTKRHVFIDDSFYVEAVTDLGETVLMFSVTTRSSRFNPTLKLGPYSTDRAAVVVRLGKTVFAELDRLGHEGRVKSSRGARRLTYVEQYYFGNPGLYQRYALSMNDAGFLRHARDVRFGVFSEEITSTLDARLREFRQAMVINTYTIAAPHADIDQLESFRLGADYDQVRVLTR